MRRDEAIGTTTIAIDIMEHVLYFGVVGWTRSFDERLDDARRNLVGQSDDEGSAKHEPQECLDAGTLGLACKEEFDEDDKIDTYPDEFAAESVPEHVCPCAAVVVHEEHQGVVVGIESLKHKNKSDNPRML